jgi:hypothetical protein
LPKGIACRRKNVPFGEASVGTSHLKVNVVTRYVRLSPDAARAMGAPGRRMTWIALAMAIVGIAQMGYGVWGEYNDQAANEVYDRDRSCVPNMLDSAVWQVNAACRIEPVVVYDRHTHGVRGRTHYYLLTVARNGTRDVTPLFGPGSEELWRRVRPTQQVLLQRFVAPGYHKTGDVMAVADSAGWSLTSHHPDAETHYSVITALLGCLLFAVGAILFRSRLKAYRPPEATA